MSVHSIDELEAEATSMRGRQLTAEEKAAISEELLGGRLRPDMGKRPLKNVLRRAIDSVRPGKTRHSN
ncbi:hypothetical protein [Antarcticirhabdus aurantiaca]|uniref:Uncharacterized protein n=1 Tax=Antarcticirhabdus aurantiaca TaxID=2606717 RepID=A0ACD4NKU2_9HYPH|nr:hypothetical protein [Antarcticirhabdus aurantiaca]WAJ27392.1 hypothetical protein OXU80_21475 [Jeongeuplla avenae]